MDIGGGVTHFQRTISSFDISPLDDGYASFLILPPPSTLLCISFFSSPQCYRPPSPYQMYEMTITGKAFLMHQVRCMAAVLFLVGNGLEQPSVIDHMLDIKRCPRKPQYGMAAPEPLILYDCTFEGLEWECDQRSHEKLLAHFQSLWTTRMVQ